MDFMELINPTCKLFEQCGKNQELKHINIMQIGRYS